MMDREVIALLPAEEKDTRRQSSPALVRLPDGRVALEELGEETVKAASPLARFRRCHPIIDPSTREVIGYEMEQVVLRAGT